MSQSNFVGNLQKDYPPGGTSKEHGDTYVTTPDIISDIIGSGVPWESFFGWMSKICRMDDA